MYVDVKIIIHLTFFFVFFFYGVFFLIGDNLKIQSPGVFFQVLLNVVELWLYFKLQFIQILIDESDPVNVTSKKTSYTQHIPS